MSGQSGKGNSSAQTQQTATNQQVATESGIAIGANSQAEISVQTADPEVARTAIAGNVVASNNALMFAGHAAEIAADTNKFATQAVQSIAGGSILAQNELATKSIDKFGDIVGANINLLQNVGQQQSDVALQAQTLAGRALDSSFAVSRAVAPQDTNFSVTELAGTASKMILYIVLGISVIFGIIFLSKKRS